MNHDLNLTAVRSYVYVKVRPSVTRFKALVWEWQGIFMGSALTICVIHRKG